jgi:hypothetical protein
MERGKHVGLSIGYGIAEGGATVKDDGNRHLTDLHLYEVSQVNVPMLRPAGLTAVKGADAEGLRSGLSLDDHLDAVLAAVPDVVARHRALVALRAPERKEGRAISSARREKLAALRDSLRVGADDLEGLLTETAPPEKAQPGPDGRALYAEFQRIAARLNGVAV